MREKRSFRRGVRKAHGPDTQGDDSLSGIILERFKRLNSLPAHPLDWQSEFFMTHFLGAKKSAMLDWRKTC